jgi:hypothetical protein
MEVTLIDPNAARRTALENNVGSAGVPENDQRVDMAARAMLLRYASDAPYIASPAPNGERGESQESREHWRPVGLCNVSLPPS